MPVGRIIVIAICIAPLVVAACFRTSLAVRIVCVLVVALFAHLTASTLPGVVGRAVMVEHGTGTSPEFLQGVVAMSEVLYFGMGNLSILIASLAVLALIPLNRKTTHRDRDAPDGAPLPHR